MQFKSIGELIKAFKTPDGNKVTSLLKNSGSLESAAKMLNTINIDTDKFTLLKGAFKDAEDDAINAALGISKVGDESTSSTSKVKNLGNAFVGAGKSAKDLFVGTITAHPIITAITAIIGSIALVSAAVTDAQEKVENAVTSAEKYQQTKSEVQSINSELETLGSQIDAINAKENLSLTDAQELANLQAQSAELERQLEIKKSLAEIEQQQAARDAKNAFSAKSSRNAIDTNGEGFWTNIADGIESFAAWFNDKTGATEAGLAQTGGLVGFIRGESNAGTPDQILSDRIKSAKEAQKKLKELQDKQTAENYDSIQSQINKQQKVVDNYATNLQELYSEMESYTKSFYDDSTGEVLNGFEEEAKRWETVQNEYLAYFGKSASSKEGAINTLFAKKQFSGLEESFTKAAQTGESAIKSLINETPGISDALDKAGVSVDEFVQHFMALGNPNALKLDEVKKQLKEAFSGDLGDNATYGDYKNYDERARQFNKFLKDKTDEEIEIFYRYVNDGDIDLSELTLEDIQELFIKVTADTSEVETAYDRVISKSSTWLATIDNVNAALVNSVSGSGLTATIDEETGTLTGNVTDIINAYKDLDGFDASTLFEETANGIHLNTDALRLLQAQEEANNKTEFLKARKELLQQLSEEQAKLNTITDQSSIEYSNQQSVIDGLQNQIQTVELLSSAYDGATSAYQKWLNAQSSGEEGDMYRNVSETMRERAKTLYDEGRVNTNEFRAIAQFYSNKDLSTASAEQVVKAYEKASGTIKKYFTGDKTGIDAFVADMKKLSDKENLGWVEELKDGSLKFNTGSDEEIADRLGISKEAIQSLYRAMTEYIDGIQIGDTSGEDTLSDQIEKAKEKAKAAQKELQDTMDSMSGENKIDLSFDIDAIDDVDELQSKINELTEYKKTLDVDSDEYQQAQDIIDGCQARIQEINNENAVLSITIDGEDGITSLKEAIDSIPEDKSSNITVSVQDSSQIENTVAEIEKIPENKTANFTFNVQNQEDADALSAKIDDLNSKRGDNKITYTVSVVDDTGDSANNKEAKVNYSLGEQEDPKDKQAKVNYFLGTQAKPNDRFAKVNYSLGTQAQPKPVTVKVNYDTSGKPKVDGTAHVNGTAPRIKSSSFNDGLLGTAHASGDWSLKQDETALTGELGREIVVRNGRFFTVGDNGAEFTKLKKGDIIFNHRQTEDLLSKGYATGRGKLIGGNAHVEGTAYSNAKGWTIGKTLGNSGSKAYDSQKSKSKKSKESTTKNTKATDKNTAATNKNTEATENLQDWIEYSTNLQSKENDRLYNAIESFEMHANQNKAIDAYITDSQAYMNTLRNAQNAYMSKANSLGLDAGYIHKIWAGDDISFEDIQDENLRDKISKYQDYYEKAKDLGDQMTELNQKIRETKISKLDNIQDDYENLVSYAKGIIDYNEAVNDLFESRNLVGNQDALMNNINQQMAIRQALVNEEKELTDQLNALVASGDIAEYTDTWLKWKTEINGVTSAIVKADSALEELKQSIMEIRYKSFEDSLNNLDFNSEMFSSIRDLMSQEGIYDDNVKLTDSGKTQLALMEQELISAKQKVANYNTAIEALAKDLAYGNITQVQFNEKLQEYQKDQMSAVKATKDARDAILDIVKDGITKESEAVQELIQKRKDDLSLQKEYYDFQKKMNDKSKEMNKIRAQIAAMEGDNSLETVAKRKKLMSQLQELEEEYNEELNDRKYDIVQDAYDKTNELTKENEEKALKELEINLNVQNEAIANALEVTKATYATVYEQLNMLAQQYNFTLTDSLTSPWLNAQSAIDSYQQAIGKVQSNVSIDTSKIQGTTPSQNQTVPTKNESSTQNLDKSANGTWLKQGNQWWYQHNDGGWTNDGWESIDGQWYKFDREGWMQTGWQPWGTDSTGNAAWYYLTDSGTMARSTWIAGANGAQYYVDSTGVMARNGYVRSADGSKYYWVNGQGVWEPQWDTYNPNLNKYKLYYNSGKKRVPYDTLAYIDDTPDHKLDLGSEAIITDKGALVQMDAGDMVFNKAQKEFLYEFSKGQIPAGARSMLPSVNTNFASMKPVNKGDININYGSLLTVNGDIDKEVFPGMQKTCESTFDYFVKNMRKYKNRLN